jgi:cobalt/nickel transport system permease protein
MIQEPFAIGNSWMHQIDPRYKIVGAVLFSTIVALSKTYPTLFGAFIFAALFVCLAKLKPAIFIKRLLLVSWFLIFLWVILPLTSPGAILFEIGPLVIKSQGIHLSAQISLKLVSILSALTALTATMPLATTGHALNRLGIPEKLVHLLLVAYRYIFVIEQEYQRIFRAAKIRGFQPRTNLHTYKTYAYMIGMIFVKASERARRVHQAMLCRGFQGKFYCFHEFAADGRDFIFAVIMVSIAVGMIFTEWGRAVIL